MFINEQHNFTLTSEITYVVRIDGILKFFSPNYEDALDYIRGFRAAVDRENAQRAKMSIDGYERPSTEC